MKKFIAFVLILGILIIAGFLAAISFPFYFYNEAVNKNDRSNWYYISHYRKEFVTPFGIKKAPENKIKNPELWKKFHFSDILLPLPNPSKNPFYTVVPGLDYDRQSKSTRFGIKIADIKGRVLSKVYALSYDTFPDYITDQKIFDLPVVRKAIRRKSSDKVWKDVFEKDISAYDISLQDMAYHLYLLNFRSKFFQKGIKSFYLLEGYKKAILQVESKDKDFNQEIIVEKRGERLFSYIISTRIDNEESQKIRDYLINNVEYLESTPTLTDIIFREFKSLSYRDQTEPTGMIYLISAWSHNLSRVEVLERAIYHLERGAKKQYELHLAENPKDINFRGANLIQLEPLYLYYYQRYRKFYSTIDLKGLNIDSTLLLKKNIELERRKKQKDELKEDAVVEPKLKRISVEEEFDALIEDTKKTQSKKRDNKLRID